MQHQNRYVIVALVPEEFSKDIEDLRKQYDQWSRQWLPPHITIVPPFAGDLSMDMIKDIENLEVKIPVSLEGWGAFHHERSNVLWLEAGDDGTKDIRKQIAKTLPALTTMFTHPAVDWAAPASHHITVVNHVPHDVYPEIEKELKKVDLKGDFTISRLTVFSWDPYTNRWLYARPR